MLSNVHMHRGDVPLLTCLKNALQLFVYNKSVMNSDHEFALVVLTHEANWVGHEIYRSGCATIYTCIHFCFTCDPFSFLLLLFLLLLPPSHCSSVTSTRIQRWCVRSSTSWRQCRRTLSPLVCLSISLSLSSLYLCTCTV